MFTAEAEDMIKGQPLTLEQWYTAASRHAAKGGKETRMVYLKVWLAGPAINLHDHICGVIGLNAVCCHVKENEICLVLDTLVVDTA